MINPEYIQSGSKYQNTPQIVAGAVATLFAVACAFGPRVGFEPHSAFLLGAGNLPQEVVTSLPFGTSRVRIPLVSPLSDYQLIVFDALDLTSFYMI